MGEEKRRQEGANEKGNMAAEMENWGRGEKQGRKKERKEEEIHEGKESGKAGKQKRAGRKEKARGNVGGKEE